ncbi:MAG: hypothetical protein IJ572_00800 [Bacilli bacterium]|nr:hypothetical protein [Bacilli bacterium]
MKRLIKSRIFMFILGLIVASTTSVFAYSIIASDVAFTPTDNTWKKSNGEPMENVKEALDDLRDTCALEPLDLEYGPFEMGSRSGYWNFTPVTINGLDKYKKLTLQGTGNMGTYISIRIYLDGQLIYTISDLNEHEFQIDHNHLLQANFYCYNNLNNGGAGIKIKAE